eukprot:237269-Amphidinium_carterae.1
MSSCIQNQTLVLAATRARIGVWVLVLANIEFMRNGLAFVCMSRYLTEFEAQKWRALYFPDAP